MAHQAMIGFYTKRLPPVLARLIVEDKHWRTASFVLSIVINLLMLGCYENDSALSRYGGCSFNTLWEVDSYCTW